MYWHVTIASVDRLAIFPSDAQRRRAAVAIARVGGASILLFCAADDHVHLVIVGERARAGRVAANVSLALRRIAAAPLDEARIRPVRDRGHLHALVRYVLDQTSHHDLSTAAHPALWPGSSFSDLVRARILPGFDPRALREALPRLSAADLFRAVGLAKIGPAADELLAGIGIAALGRHAAEVVGQDSLQQRHVNGARALVAALGVRLGVPVARVADAVGTTVRHTRRLAALPPSAELEAALRLQVGLRHAVATHTPT